MRLLDANLLVYAHDASAAEHAAARAWFERLLGDPARVAMPWPSLLAFVRLVSNPLVVRAPVAPGEAWARVAEWLTRDQVWIPQPGPQHADILGRLLAAPGISQPTGARRTSGRARARARGLRLCSTDGDFAKFPDLTWENPLAGNAGHTRRG